MNKPKFILPMEHDFSHKDGVPCMFSTNIFIYGPVDESEINTLINKVYPQGSEGIKFLILDGYYIEGKKNPLEKPEDQKRVAGNHDFYIHKENEEGYTCKECGTDILSVRVAHPIHFKPGVGGGECEYTEAPYCPNCEKKPDSSGDPIIKSMN